MISKSWKEFKHGQALFSKSVENENFNKDLAIDAIDCINHAQKIAFLIDTELEAYCHRNLG